MCRYNKVNDKDAAAVDAVVPPIFFYTGNEANVELYMNVTGIMWESAQRFGAILVFAEHRYYGKSRPKVAAAGAEAGAEATWAAMEAEAAGAAAAVAGAAGAGTIAEATPSESIPAKATPAARDLAYLTSEQAMADYATLIRDIKEEIGAPDAPVITFGGSYGGMLSTWWGLYKLISVYP